MCIRFHLNHVQKRFPPPPPQMRISNAHGHRGVYGGDRTCVPTTLTWCGTEILDDGHLLRARETRLKTAGRRSRATCAAVRTTALYAARSRAARPRRRGGRLRRLHRRRARKNVPRPSGAGRERTARRTRRNGFVFLLPTVRQPLRLSSVPPPRRQRRPTRRRRTRV